MTGTTICLNFRFSALLGASGITVIFLVSVFSPFCPSAICVLSAVQPIISVWISRTSWRNWTGTESTLKMSAEEFACFLSLLDKGNDGNISPPVLNVQESNQAPPDDSPSGLDLGNLFGLDAIQSGAEDFECHVDLPRPASSIDTPFTRADVNKAHFEARLQSLDDTELKYPWESGVMGDIFPETTDVAGIPTLPAEYLCLTDQLDLATTLSAPQSVSQKVSGRDLELPFYSFAIKVKPDKDMFAEQEVLWARAIGKWLQVFEVLGFPGQLGAALENELHFADPTEHGLVLRDALGVKSPQTAVKRAQTLLQYFRWLHGTCTDCEPWERSHCLEYLRSTDVRTPAASLGMSFLEAIRFARHVMQIPIQDALLQDPQLKGRAQRLMLSRDAYHPARPMKSYEVAKLENLMLEQLDAIDKYMLGAVLFAIFSRSRWSDLQFIHRMWVDRNEYEGQFFGFIETETSFHKTATSLKKKMRFLPVVCPIQGITEVDWTPVWLETFAMLHVDLEACPFGPIAGHLEPMATFARDHVPLMRFLHLLTKFLGIVDSDRLTSHSFKHTTLSWASSYGLDEPARTLLGHHELKGARAMTVYSRDMLTRPLQLYCSMLKNIRGDHFRPDESRTSRMLDLMKIQQGVMVGKDADAALKPVTADAQMHRPKTIAWRQMMKWFLLHRSRMLFHLPGAARDRAVMKVKMTATLWHRQVQAALMQAMILLRKLSAGVILLKVQSSGTSSLMLCTSVPLWMAEPCVTD